MSKSKVLPTLLLDAEALMVRAIILLENIPSGQRHLRERLFNKLDDYLDNFKIAYKMTNTQEKINKLEELEEYLECVERYFKYFNKDFKSLSEPHYIEITQSLGCLFSQLDSWRQSILKKINTNKPETK